MNFDHLKADWFNILTFWLKPVLTVLVWYITDSIITKLLRRSTCVERLFSRHVRNEANRHALEQRINTFKGLLLQSVRVLNAVFFIFILLDSFRIDIKPLLAGLGVAGLALSLAAQNILRDFLNGLFIVIEDQFNLGDVIEVGSFSGTVEAFTMRTTKLRTSDGKLIVIPNGTISQVVNNTKNFSVSVVNVGVSYDTDIPKAMEVLGRCAKELKNRQASVIIADSSVLGIMDFRDNDIQLQVTTKTLPGQQWGVGRTLRLIIKEYFDREGIEIPFPQRVMHIAADSSLRLTQNENPAAKIPDRVNEAGQNTEAKAKEGNETAAEVPQP